MNTTMIPGCCGLKTIHRINCLGKEDAMSEKEAAGFDALVNTGKAQTGEWANYGKAPDTIAIISENPSYTKPEEFKRQEKFLTQKGWKLLAIWKSHESGLKNYMYGSPEMKPAG
jgi:hypothetical protein